MIVIAPTIVVAVVFAIPIVIVVMVPVSHVTTIGHSHFHRTIQAESQDRIAGHVDGSTLNVPAV
jgi:hypothetical protein